MSDRRRSGKQPAQHRNGAGTAGPQNEAPDRRQRLLAGLLLGAAIAGAAIVLAFRYPWGSIPYFAVDFTVFHAASRALAHFDSPWLLENLVRYAPPDTINEVLAYSYPPLLAELLLPLSPLSLDTAARIWIAINLTAPLVALIALLTATRWRPHPYLLAGLILAVMLFLPNLYTYLSGQASLWVLAWAALGVLALAAGAEGRAGVAWALAWAKPHPALLLPVLLVRRRKGLIGFAAVTAVSLVLAIPWLPTWGAAIARAFQANDLGLDGLHQATALGLVGALGPAGLAIRAAALIAALGVVIALVRRGAGWKEQAVAAIALGMVASPYLGRSDVALALIPMLLMASEYRERRGPALLSLVAWFVPALAALVYALTPLQWPLLPIVWGSAVQWIVAAAALWYVWPVLRPAGESLSSRGEPLVASRSKVD